MAGLKLETTRGDILKGIMEGTAFYLKQVVDGLPATGIRIDEFRATGGGSKSDAWIQLCADILGRPFVRPEVTEAGALGAALMAGVGCGRVRVVRGGRGGDGAAGAHLRAGCGQPRGLRRQLRAVRAAVAADGRLPCASWPQRSAEGRFGLTTETRRARRKAGNSVAPGLVSAAQAGPACAGWSYSCSMRLTWRRSHEMATGS